MDSNSDPLCAQKIVSVSDHMNGLKYEGKEKSESFIVDLESFSNGGVDRDASHNSRITLQRSLSRKGPQRGAERKISNQQDNTILASSPRGAQVGATNPEKTGTPTLAMGSQDHSHNLQLPQHQITIKTSSLGAPAEARWGRRSSFRRTPSSWFFDPKRILLFFATLSSMGTILLIYLTLSVAKTNDNDSGDLDWQQ